MWSPEDSNQKSFTSVVMATFNMADMYFLWGYYNTGEVDFHYLKHWRAGMNGDNKVYV